MNRCAAVVCVCLAWLPGDVARAGDPVADAIKKLQKEKKAEDRALWAKFLGGRDQREAVAALAQALQDKDRLVRRAAASALWETGEKAKDAEPALRKALEDTDPQVIALAAGALEVMDVDPKELAAARRLALRETLRSEPYPAFLAARGLIGIDPPATVVPGILPFLAAESAAMEQPSGWGDHHENVELAQEALQRVAKTGDRSAIPLLVAELDRSPASAESLLVALGLYKPPPDRFVEIVGRQTQSRYARARNEAARRFRDLTSEADVHTWVPQATAMTRDSDKGVRQQALSALEKAGGLAAGAAPDVIQLLKQDPVADVRRAAAETLGAIGDASQPVSRQTKAQVAEQARGPLRVAALNDKDDRAAEEAVAAYNLLLLPPSETVETLVQVAESAAPTRVRQRALGALRNREGQGKAVVERVRALTKSPEANVAADARYAVEAIQRGGPGTPNPGGPATAPGTAAAAARRDPDAETRGLTKLRELKIAFVEKEFYSALMGPTPEAVQAFLDAGMSASLAFGDSANRSPLMVLFFHSCKRGAPTPDATHAALKALLAAGGNVNQTDEVGNTPLMFAADGCDWATSQALLAAGAKLSALRPGDGSSALTRALGKNNPVAERLIAVGARLRAQDVKDYLDGYKDDAKTLALVKKAAP